MTHEVDYEKVYGVSRNVNLVKRNKYVHAQCTTACTQ